MTAYFPVVKSMEYAPNCFQNANAIHFIVNTAVAKKTNVVNRKIAIKKIQLRSLVIFLFSF